MRPQSLRDSIGGGAGNPGYLFRPKRWHNIAARSICGLARIRRDAPVFEPDEPVEPTAEELERIYQRAPAGALTVAGIAMALVFSLWLVFYLAVFLPRGFQQ
jgi:hypothetical protein